MWLEDIGVVWRTVFEAVVFAKAVFVGGVSPGGCGLGPVWGFFGHGDVGVAEWYGGVGPMFRVKVGALGLVAAEVMSRNHTLVLADSIFS